MYCEALPSFRIFRNCEMCTARFPRTPLWKKCVEIHKTEMFTPYYFCVHREMGEPCIGCRRC